MNSLYYYLKLMGEIFELSIRKCSQESTEMDINIYSSEEIIVNYKFELMRASIVSNVHSPPHTHTPSKMKSTVLVRPCLCTHTHWKYMKIHALME